MEMWGWAEMTVGGLSAEDQKGLMAKIQLFFRQTTKT